MLMMYASWRGIVNTPLFYPFVRYFFSVFGRYPSDTSLYVRTYKSQLPSATLKTGDAAQKIVNAPSVLLEWTSHQREWIIRKIFDRYTNFSSHTNRVFFILKENCKFINSKNKISWKWRCLLYHVFCWVWHLHKMCQLTNHQCCKIVSTKIQLHVYKQRYVIIWSEHFLSSVLFNREYFPHFYYHCA